MNDFELKPSKSVTKKRKRIGRGPGSGQGCTAGRGNNGQKSRSGRKKRPWFEGGQMPLQRRVPKRGFTNIFRIFYQVVNVKDLNRFKEGAVVDIESLYKMRLVRKKKSPVKILGDGDLSKKLSLKVNLITKSAEKKVKAAGGSIELVSLTKQPAGKEDKKEKKI